MSDIETMIMIHQQALHQEHGERAPRSADELSKVCKCPEPHVYLCIGCVAFRCCPAFEIGSSRHEDPV